MPLNVLFGLAAAWAIAKFEFRGKSLLITLIDLPFSVSPVVAGPDVRRAVRRCKASSASGSTRTTSRSSSPCPGIVLATVFVTFPFVARELIPVMQATGTEQEQAALTLGANGWQTFWHVTLPSVKWGLIYGIILCNARAMGEFGAVSRRQRQHRRPDRDHAAARRELYKEYQGAGGAFAVASLLALLALLTLGIKTFLEWKQAREFEQAQQAPQPVSDRTRRS